MLGNPPICQLRTRRWQGIFPLGAREFRFVRYIRSFTCFLSLWQQLTGGSITVGKILQKRKCYYENRQTPSDGPVVRPGSGAQGQQLVDLDLVEA